jgi:hypothetical protein
MHTYTVEIPLRANMLAGIYSSSGDGLPDDYDFEGVLRIRMGKGTTIPIWYLDFFNRKAEAKSEAIRQVLPIALRFVKFVALTHNRGFEIDIAGSNAKRIDIGSGVELSDYAYFASLPANLNEMATLWKQYDEIDTEDGEELKRKNLINDALDWIYLGKTMRDQRNQLLAYVTALEILLNYEEVETVLRRSITERTHKRLGNTLKQFIIDAKQYGRAIKGIAEIEYTEARYQLIPQIDDILKPYIEDEELRKRIINRVVDTEAEGKTARWKKVLDAAEIYTTKKELGEIYGARSSSSHTGNSNKALPVERAHEIATLYIKKLLLQHQCIEQ